MITINNYEEYIISYVDGELTAQEQQELLAFIDAHSELKKELEAYQMARFTPEAEEVYERKETLLKPVRKVIALRQWIAYGTAAGLALLIGINIWQYKAANNTPGAVVQAPITTTIHSPQPAPQPITPAIQRPVIKGTIATNHTPIKKPKTERIKPIAPQPEAQPAPEQVAKQEEEKTTQLPEIEKEQQEQEPIQIAEVQQPANNTPADTPLLAAMPDKKLLDKLPISDEQKKVINAVATIVTSGYEQLQSIKAEIKDRSLAISIDKKSIKISF